ncbi:MULTISPECIES: carbon storage regulator [Bacillaceae]|uniref:Translational regulator CsrA n=1 Tax=Evansella alkalicola TaxID=745819 RepID=A0ABS6JVL1_9BACI|nr:MULTISPECIES: carbon storage regulator [Bacillaceae]MBU9722287.1 carbon storage regulator [Bacillus alkalicola]
MLVLGRKPGEYVVIDDQIVVKVVRGAAGQLRLAIEAPKHMDITRGEVYEANQKTAAALAGNAIALKNEITVS